MIAMKVVQENECQFLQKVRSLWRKRIFVYIDEEFAINRVQPKFLSILLTGKFRRGVTERVPLKRIFTSQCFFSVLGEWWRGLSKGEN